MSEATPAKDYYMQPGKFFQKRGVTLVFVGNAYIGSTKSGAPLRVFIEISNQRMQEGSEVVIFLNNGAAVKIFYKPRIFDSTAECEEK